MIRKKAFSCYKYISLEASWIQNIILFGSPFFRSFSSCQNLPGMGVWEGNFLYHSNKLAWSRTSWKGGGTSHGRQMKTSQGRAILLFMMLIKIENFFRCHIKLHAERISFLLPLTPPLGQTTSRIAMNNNFPSFPFLSALLVSLERPRRSWQVESGLQAD